MSDNNSTRWTRSHKIRALLAGGVVLGVGAAVTLAAWNDSEFAKGDFAAGSFNIEGSTDGTAYAEQDTTGTAAAVFNLTDHGNVSPGDVLYKSFWVRLDQATTNDATMVLTTTAPAATAGDNTSNLSYAIYADPTSCDAGGVTAATAVWEGTTLDARPGSPATVSLTKGTPGTTPGTAVQLCFQVTAGAGLTQAATASTVWEFKATSVS